MFNYLQIKVYYLQVTNILLITYNIEEMGNSSGVRVHACAYRIMVIGQRFQKFFNKVNDWLLNSLSFQSLK